MDKIKCDFFHETDGECCSNRCDCYLADCTIPIATRVQTAPFHPPLDMKTFFVILGFAAVCYVFGLFILAQYQPRSTTYLAPLARMVP